MGEYEDFLNISKESVTCTKMQYVSYDIPVNTTYQSKKLKLASSSNGNGFVNQIAVGDLVSYSTNPSVEYKIQKINTADNIGLDSILKVTVGLNTI
jgi:hypothetical protein